MKCGVWHCGDPALFLVAANVFYGDYTREPPIFTVGFSRTTMRYEVRVSQQVHAAARRRDAVPMCRAHAVDVGWTEALQEELEGFAS